ncbi:MATE family efflux transporter [Clostridioides sp. ES-S-0049-02]
MFSFRIKECCFSNEIMSEILKIGVPTLIFQLLTSLAITLTNMEATKYGDSVIAGMGAVTRIMSLGSLIVFGFIKGFQPIAGYNFGSKNYDRLHQAIKTSIAWTTLFCVVLGLVMVFFPTAIISQFTSGDVLLIENGSKALRANGFSFMLFGFYTVYSTLFLALGKAKEGGLLGMCRQGICFIPIILIIPIFWGLNGILYAQPIADFAAAIIAGFMAIKLHKELHTLKINSISSK